MDVFVVMEYIMCEDYYYGYNEYLRSIYGTYEEAKLYVDNLLDKKKYDGKNENPFIQIICMKLGNTEKEVLFDSTEDNSENEETVIFSLTPAKIYTSEDLK
jgi:hypothetical protein